jgi:putative membrane protein
VEFMRGFVWRWILNALALYATAFIVNGIEITGIGAALVASLVWGLVNAVIRPVINILTLPINILTVGLFSLVVNGFLLWLVADVVRGFEVAGILVGILGAIVLSVVSSILSALISDK